MLAGLPMEQHLLITAPYLSSQTAAVTIGISLLYMRGQPLRDSVLFASGSLCHQLCDPSVPESSLG